VAFGFVHNALPIIRICLIAVLFAEPIVMNRQGLLKKLFGLKYSLPQAKQSISVQPASALTHSNSRQTDLDSQDFRGRPVRLVQLGSWPFLTILQQIGANLLQANQSIPMQPVFRLPALARSWNPIYLNFRPFLTLEVTSLSSERALSPPEPYCVKFVPWLL
jgi:hypothetical protein